MEVKPPFTETAKRWALCVGFWLAIGLTAYHLSEATTCVAQSKTSFTEVLANFLKEKLWP